MPHSGEAVSKAQALLATTLAHCADVRGREAELRQELDELRPELDALHRRTSMAQKSIVELGRSKRLGRSNGGGVIRRLAVQTAFKRRSNGVQTFRGIARGAQKGAKIGKNSAPFQGIYSDPSAFRAEIWLARGFCCASATATRPYRTPRLSRRRFDRDIPS